MTRYEHIITGGIFVTMDSGYRVLEDHFMLINEGRIVDILPMAQLKGFKAKKKTDATGCLITPGFVNAHSHLPMTYFRGWADDLPLDIWLKDYIWPLEARMLTPDFVYDASLHGAAEMIRNGITLTNDMYFFVDRIAEACSKAGLRVIVSEAIIEPDYQGDPEEFGRKVQKLKDQYRENPLVDCSIAPHAIYTCSKEVLQACSQAAAENDWIIHTHLSENQTELEDCLKHHGKRPVDYLDRLGFLEAHCVFAHGVWLNEVEVKTLAKHGAAVALCTDSNLKLSNGFAPIKEMLEHEVNLALGTDGVASNNNLDILEELSTTAKLHKAVNRDPVLLPAREAFSLLTIEGARALNRSHDLGSLEQGKWADLCIIDTRNIKSQPLYNPYSYLVYSAGSEQIRDVMIAGRFVMRDRALPHLDEADLISKATKYQNEIIRTMKP
jgi:5-methylthioadenosine/S-adenosylhomocysteine deaminase